SYFKFLRASAVSPFTGYVWGPGAGDWVDAGPAGPCRRGIHARRGGELPFWLAEELWRVELGGPVVVSGDQGGAPRARAASRIERWTPETADELGRMCTARVAHHAADELREIDLAGMADALEVAGRAFARGGTGDVLAGRARAASEAVIRAKESSRVKES